MLQNPGNHGKGYSVRNGLLHSFGEVVMFTDADLSAPIEEADGLFAAIAGGADIAIGSRWLERTRQTIRQPLYRQFFGRCFNAVTRAVMGLPYADTQCGFKAFTRAAAQTVFQLQTIERWGFDPEILFIALKRGYRVVEVPVSWAHDERTRISYLQDGTGCSRTSPSSAGTLCSAATTSLWSASTAPASSSSGPLRVLCGCYLTKNRRPLCSGCRWHIARQVMPSLPGQQCKCRGFFGLRRKTKVLAYRQLATQRLKPFRKHRHQRPVARSAAGDDVIDSSAPHPATNKSFVASRNCLSRQCGCRGQRILGPFAVPFAVG